MTPFPWVARILPQRFVLPDLQNLHSPHSGVLWKRCVSLWCLLWGDNCKEDAGILERDDMVAGLDVCYSFADGFDNTGAFVSEDDGESSLGIFAGKCVGIYGLSILIPSYPSYLIVQRCCWTNESHTCMADTSVVDLYADLMRLWWCDFDIFDAEVLAGFPGNGGLLHRIMG